MTAPPPTAPPPAVQPQAGWPGYVPVAPSVAGSVPRPRHSSHKKVLGLLVLVGALVAGVVVGISAALSPGAKTWVCPPDCPAPPHGVPLAGGRPTFTGPGGAYTFEYVPPGTYGDIKVTVSKSRTGITLRASHGPTTMKIFGADSHGRTAQQVVHDLVASSYPDASLAYQVPNAFVGYRPGYGEVEDVPVHSSEGSAQRVRLVVMAAVKGGTAVVAAAVGPYEAATPASTSHPTGLGLLIASQALDPIVNSIRWKGDPPR